MQVQSSADVKLRPEEEMTVRVPTNDPPDLKDGAIRVVRKAWLTECDGDEGIPFVPVQKLGPSLF